MLKGRSPMSGIHVFPLGDIGCPNPADFQKAAEPWQGSAVVLVEPGQTARGIVVDFRPPGPLVETPDTAKTISFDALS